MIHEGVGQMGNYTHGNGSQILTVGKENYNCRMGETKNEPCGVGPKIEMM